MRRKHAFLTAGAIATVVAGASLAYAQTDRGTAAEGVAGESQAVAALNRATGPADALPPGPARVVHDQIPALDFATLRLVGADGNARLFVGRSTDPASGAFCGVALSEFPAGWLTMAGCADAPTDLLLKVQRAYGGPGTPTVALGVVPNGTVSATAAGRTAVRVQGNLVSFPTPNDVPTPAVEVTPTP